MPGDDEEIRGRRAQRLRRRSRELAKGRSPEQPPRSPHEFIEREMHERAATEPEEAERNLCETAEQRDDDAT